MPWRKTQPMDQKIRLIADWKELEYHITDLAKLYEVSRKTVHKWVRRYEEEGIDGLKEKSRAPINSPNKTKESIIKALIEEKCNHRNWGPKKITAFLRRRYPKEYWPAASTTGEWLKKAGLTGKRKKRSNVPSYSEPFSKCNLSNDVWSADYKGQFRTKDRRLCYPLTISDNHARYLLECKALEGPRYRETKLVFETVFKQYGLPSAIRIDNGTPFAGRNVTGLSRLSMWWIKLGIIPERIDKGAPEQNGRHERMHRTLKEETVNPPAINLKYQQEKFDWFRVEYNEDRPHEALGQEPPISVYKRSEREYTEKPFIPEYDLDFYVRCVKRGGEIKFKGNLYFLTEVLGGERVGLKEIDEDKWQINFGFQPIGTLNLRKKRIEPIEKCNRCSRSKV